ncbi:MAG: endonuclease/exonuclease/phosphatase family protein [Thermosynechococcaceae cyanobacterium]
MSLFFVYFSLLWSGGLFFIYHHFLGYSWPVSLLTEMWPYLLILPIGAWILQLAKPALRKRYILLSLATLLLLLNSFPVLSWYGLPQLQHSSEGIRVMTYNIWIHNENYAAVQKSIQKNLDIVLLTEVSSEAMLVLKNHLAYPYSYRTTGGNNALLSRYPILEVTSDLLGVSVKGRTYNLVARLNVEDRPVTLIGVHPPIPALSKYFQVRNRQLDALAEHVRSLEGQVIVLGDFNTTPWSPYLRLFERSAKVENAGRGRGIYATWHYHSNLPKSLLKVPIDHIETRGFKVIHTWVGDAGNSDHRPVITLLQSR